MNNNLWFKEGDNAPWIRGCFRAWATEGERLGDYSNARPVGIVECVSTGRVLSVPLSRLMFGPRPADGERVRTP